MSDCGGILWGYKVKSTVERRLVQLEASGVAQRLSYPTEAFVTKKITRDRIVLSFKDSNRNH